MRTILALIVLILIPSVSNAADVPEHIFKQCREKAQKMKLTRVTYKFGKLIFDNTKSTDQVRSMCHSSDAAGCFQGTTAAYTVGVENYHTFNVGKYSCVAPQLYVDYYWNDAYIFVTKEYAACQRRVILRHELQHFTIWKTAQNYVLTESKRALNNLALSRVTVLSDDSVGEFASPSLVRDATQVLKNINNEWNDVSIRNNNLLDEIDHNMDTEVNYRVCMPYSIELLQYDNIFHFR